LKSSVKFRFHSKTKIMKRIAAIFGLCALLFTAGPLHAGQNLVKGLRIWAAPDHTRVVFDTSSPVEHSVELYRNPERLVVDIKNARLNTGGVPTPASGSRYIRKIRHSPRNGNDLRVVFDLKQPVRPKTFPLAPNDLYGHRLVLDLEPRAETDATPKKVLEAPARSDRSSRGRDLVIAVDAGHGGDDPGARGPRGTFEKDVVLSIARRLARKIDQEPGMRAVLIRDGDYFIGLKKRTELAREARADLLVSIHADSFPNDKRVGGSSVYTLSQRGASNEAAKWLAERENRSDQMGGVELVGGVELDQQSSQVAQVLLDLSMAATMESSRHAADNVLKELKKLGKTHKHSVQHAGFRVLKAPDVPSMLVETAFISNPREEARLRSPSHQERLATALLEGVREYFRNFPPTGTWMAQNSPRRHVIAYGDTLSTIAQQYRLKVSDLRNANQLRGDHIRVGQILTIPDT
jgi:N-acetylmuramoyl-L-alanine amidase